MNVFKSLKCVPDRKQSNRHNGWTLIEALTVISVIAVLSALLGSSLSIAKRKAHRMGCSNNLRQLNLAALLFSNDDPDGAYSQTLTDSNDRFNWLYPNWIPTLETYTCPGGSNVIRTKPTVNDPVDGREKPADLEYCAWERGGYGSSYEIFGFMGFNRGWRSRFRLGDQWIETEGIRKTYQTAQTYSRVSEALGMRGVIPGPSQIWLILDGDETLDPDDTNNFPDAGDNHHASGANVTFCDGHLEWVKRERYLVAYEISQDEARVQRMD